MHLSKEKLTDLSQEDMFAVVNDVVCYPEFLPYCDRVVIKEQSDDYMITDIYVSDSKRFIKHNFSTYNTFVTDSSINIKLIQGPLKQMWVNWSFVKQGDGCLIKLSIDLEAKSKLLNFGLNSFFDSYAKSMLDAFIKRAKQVYEKN